MKKAICRTYYLNKLNAEQQEFIGYDPGYLWRSTDFFNGPRKAGRYLVICKDGCIREMMSTGTHNSEEAGRILFELAANCSGDGASFIDDRDMTDCDIMSIYRSPSGRWYTLESWQDDDDNYGTDVHEYTKLSEQYPLYFLDLNLDDKIEMDEKGEIAGTDAIQYFKRNLNGEFEKEEEE
jgi:hypothetical protein